MKAKRLLASALALSMAFGAMSALAVTANAAETTATITAYNSNGDQVGTYTTLYDAANAAGENARITISEGTVALNCTDMPRISGNVTIEGAGSDKTKIIPANTQDFIDALTSNDNKLEWKGYALLEFFQPDGEDHAFNLTLKGLTLDGTGIYGTIEEGTIIKREKPINFVPLRLSGNRNNPNNPATFTLEDIVIKRNAGKDNKGCIQIGTSNGSYGATVTATDLYLDSNAGESNYADIDICENCSLEITSGGFNGIVLGTFTAPDVPGYYSATISVSDPDSFWGTGKQTLTLYTTIPYLLNAYENNAENLKNYIGHFDSFTGGKDILNDMAGDLANMNLQLYGYTCDEKKALAQEFNAAIDDLNANISFDNKNTLITALEKADWHTWENEQDTDCNVCGYKREVAPEPEVTTSTATVGEGTEDYDNTFATGFVTTIPSGAEVTSVKWQVTSSGTTKETETFTVDANLDLSGDLKLGLIINGLNDPTATATAIINPAEVTD